MIKDKGQRTKPACLKWDCLKSKVVRSQAGVKDKACLPEMGLPKEQSSTQSGRGKG